MGLPKNTSTIRFSFSSPGYTVEVSKFSEGYWSPMFIVALDKTAMKQNQPGYLPMEGTMQSYHTMKKKEIMQENGWN